MVQSSASQKAYSGRKENMKENKKWWGLLLEGGLGCIFIMNIGIAFIGGASLTIILRIVTTIFFIVVIAWYLLLNIITGMKNNREKKIYKLFEIFQMIFFIDLGFNLQLIIENIMVDFELSNLEEVTIIVLSEILILSFCKDEIQKVSTESENEENEEEALN